MSQQSKREYFEQIYWRYRQACKREKAQILNEFCRVCGYNRKYAIRKLHGPPPEEHKARPRKPRGYTYAKPVISILEAVWAVAGYPWSVRLKALLPLWMPWIRRRYQVLPSVEQKLLAISARQMDRRFRSHKRLLRRRIYGRTKPGRWLKHQIPLRLDKWNIQQPGYVEVDLVSHSGNRAAGDFLYSLNLTDIYTGWVETRAVRGKGQRGVVAALDEIRKALPFPLYGIDSDNGSEFTLAPAQTAGAVQVLMRSCGSIASAIRFSSPAGDPTRKTTTPTSSRRTGRMCAAYSAGSVTRAR